jgi:S1-C subfamily serine protease
MLESVEEDDGFDDDAPTAPLLPLDDRLWRHPSEVGGGPRRQRRFGLFTAGGEPRVLAIAVLSGLISSLLTTGLIAVAGGFENRTVTHRSVEKEAALPVSASRNSGNGSNANIDEIAERVRPAIVQIEVEGSEGKGSGSGMLLRTDGHVLTNQHVINGADKITVVMADGRELPGTLIGGDPDTDVAVVKVDGGSLPTATLGSATNLKVGNQAIAIGSPLGLAGGPSLSVGVVSALGRQVDSRDGPPLLDMIQTDAPIAPGSSGGALLDSTGSVIGITTAIAVSDVGAEGLGFATPIDIARDVAEQLITTGKVVHVWLGIEGEDGTGNTGALVRKIRPDSPAAKAGVKERDIITAVAGKPVTSMSALVIALRTRKPGQVVTLGLTRDGKPMTVEATLVERPRNL